MYSTTYPPKVQNINYIVNSVSDSLCHCLFIFKCLTPVVTILT